MSAGKADYRYPGPGVWLTVLLALAGLAVWLLTAETGVVNAALKRQATERLQDPRFRKEPPVVVFLGSSILKHAVPFDNAFDTAFTTRTGNRVQAVRFIRYQGSALDYLPVLDSLIRNPPELLVIDEALLLTNRQTPVESPLEIFRSQIRSLAGSEDNFLRFALRANSPADETDFLSDKRNNRQLKQDVSREELELKAKGLLHGVNPDRPLLAPRLVKRLIQLSEQGTSIRVLVLPRIAQFEKNPTMVSLKTQLATEFHRTVPDSQNIAFWPAIPITENHFFCDPGHLNIRGRHHVLPFIIQLVHQELYADSVR